MDVAKMEAILYVKSRKAVSSFYRPKSTQVETTDSGGHVGLGMSTSGGTNISEDMAEVDTGFVLSDEQAQAVALLEDVAPKRGYTLKIVDVTRTNVIKQMLDSHLKGVEAYPVLVVPVSGRRLEGPEAFTEMNVISLLPAELPHIRAFTRLKVKAAQVEQIRTALMAYDEVKETHLITGEWDIFVVLEFTQGEKGASTKRRVINFVIEKIGKLDGVEDTSTLVPEDSISKFPF